MEKKDTKNAEIRSRKWRGFGARERIWLNRHGKRGVENGISGSPFTRRARKVSTGVCVAARLPGLRLWVLITKGGKFH